MPILDEIDAALMAWDVSESMERRDRMAQALGAAGGAAWRPVNLGLAEVIFGGEPILAWFPPAGRGELSKVQVVERFDGWTPPPALWMPVQMPVRLGTTIPDSLQRHVGRRKPRAIDEEDVA